MKTMFNSNLLRGNDVMMLLQLNILNGELKMEFNEYDRISYPKCSTLSENTV